MTAKAIMSMNTVTMMKKKAFFPSRDAPGGGLETLAADMASSRANDQRGYAGRTYTVNNR